MEIFESPETHPDHAQGAGAHGPHDELEHSHGEGRHGHQASLGDALDFVNTLEYDKGSPDEHLTDVPTAVLWLQEHALLHREMVGPLLERYKGEDEDTLLQRIRRLRGALRELLDATVDERPPEGSALREVNRALRAQYLIELVPASDGVSLDHRHEGDPISGAMARIAEAVARELTQGESKRMRICANEECRWVFRDYSPAGRRKWCDMSTCGNRAKAARHRERQKAKEDPDSADSPDSGLETPDSGLSVGPAEALH
ncbi:MAG: CGNR zinc finger domain-containing protein [Candidatus Limnocylindrales bacterium]